MRQRVVGRLKFLWFCAMSFVATWFYFLVLLVWVNYSVWRDPASRSRATQQVATLWARTLFRLMPGWDVTIEGADKLRQNLGRGVIVVANHQSYADIPVAYFLPMTFRWLSKAEVFRVPLVGTGMRWAGCVPVKRGNRMSQGEAFKACEEALAQGDSVWFFPEGTRTPDGHIQSFRPGAFRLSQQTGAPILPIVLWGTREFNPKGTLSIGSGMARLMVLDPVLSEAGETAEAFTSRVREMMVRVYQAG